MLTQIFSPEVLIGLRWIHFAAGITWIGLLFWFNLVNVPFQRVLDPALKPQVNPPLMRRALAWFRHAATLTVLAGVLLIYGLYWQDGDILGSNTEITILAGGILGLIMWANVWMFIWPNQRRALAAMDAGQTPDPAWPRTALYASRTNFALAFPMLFFMAGSSHYPLDWTGVLVVGVVLGAFGALVVLTVQKYWAARF
jgi:uncharacterized membrane protein